MKWKSIGIFCGLLASALFAIFFVNLESPKSTGFKRIESNNSKYSQVTEPSLPDVESFVAKRSESTDVENLSLKTSLYNTVLSCRGVPDDEKKLEEEIEGIFRLYSGGDLEKQSIHISSVQEQYEACKSYQNITLEDAYLKLQDAAKMEYGPALLELAVSLPPDLQNLDVDSLSLSEQKKIQDKVNDDRLRLLSKAVSLGNAEAGIILSSDYQRNRYGSSLEDKVNFMAYGIIAYEFSPSSPLIVNYYHKHIEDRYYSLSTMEMLAIDNRVAEIKSEM